MRPHQVFVAKPIPALLAAFLFFPMPVYADGSTNLGTVSAEANNNSSSPSSGSIDNSTLSPQQVLSSTQPVQVVTSQDISLFGPNASGVQSLSILPNVAVTGYNAGSVSGRSTISMRGVKVGWNSVPGDLETNGITAEFDGVPLNSLIQHTGWHSVEIPIGALLGGVNAINGPGNPRERWYDSLGGTINFVPVQPAKKAEANVALSYGSNQAISASAIANTGNLDGWSTVFGAAHAQGDTFRTGEYNWPSKSDQFYAKTRKQFDNGTFSVGAYWQRNNEYRPNMIPTQPIPGITLYGLNANGPLYSQQTTGFYSSLPKDVWFKNNTIENYLAWSRLHLDLSGNLHLTNLFWYRNGNVFHYRINSAFPQNNPTDTEHFKEYSDTWGDKLVFDTLLPASNHLSFGGYWIHARAVSEYLGYNEALGTSLSNPVSIGFNTFYNTYLAGFAQDTFKPTHAIALVPGLRIVNYRTDFVNNNASQALSYPAPGPSYNTNPNLTRNFTRAEPSLGATYALLPSLTLFGHYAVTYQNPTANNFNNTQTDLSALKPVRSTNYEFGARLLSRDILGMRRVIGSISFFHNHIADQTIPVQPANNPNVTSFGYGAATLKGVDLSFKGDVNDHWSAFANMGWLDANWDSYYSTTDNQSYDGLPVSNSPKMTLNAGLTYRYYLENASIETTLWDQYFAHSYLFNNGTGAPTSQTIPGYNLLNLSVNARTIAFNHLIPGVKVTRLSLQVLNALDRKYNSTEYITAGGYFGGNSAGAILANPGAPRTIFATAAFDF